MAEFLEYDYGSGYGVFGSYADYDDNMAYFEQALDVSHRRREKVEYDEIDRIITDAERSLARGVLDVFIQVGVFDQTRESVAYAITKNFAGSSSRRLISLAPGYSDIEGGLILLDDGSQLQFNKGTSAIAMFDIDNALRSAILRAKAS